MSENRTQAARVFEESLDAVEAARVVRERTEQIRCEIGLVKRREAPAPVSPDAEATLRRMLCESPCA